MRARKPSHLGSKIQSPSVGRWLTRFASIGSRGGFTGSCMHPSYTAPAVVARVDGGVLRAQNWTAGDLSPLPRQVAATKAPTGRRTPNRHYGSSSLIHVVLF